jgi:hypothetical protein
MPSGQTPTREAEVVTRFAESEHSTVTDAESSPSGDGGDSTAQRASSDRSDTGPASPWALSAGPALHALPANSALLFGAEVALSWRRLTAGVLGGLGGDSDRLGRVGFRRLHGFVAYEALSTQPATFRVTAALRAAFGATLTDVTPIAAALHRNATAASGDVALEAGVRWTLSPRWQTKLGLDVGYAFGPRLRADDRDLANFAGFFIGASLCAVAALGGAVH